MTVTHHDTVPRMEMKWKLKYISQNLDLSQHMTHCPVNLILTVLPEGGQKAT